MCIHGFSSGGQFFLVAIGFWGHCGGGACVFIARLLAVIWRAVAGDRRWARTLACCGTILRLHRPVATSVLRGLPAFYRSGAFCAFPAFLSSRLAFGADGVGYGTAGLGGGWHLRRSPRRQGGGRWGRRFVWADGAAARAHLGRFFLSPCGLRCTSSRHSAGRQCAYGRRCALQRG